eukprot:g351.t1
MIAIAIEEAFAHRCAAPASPVSAQPSVRAPAWVRGYKPSLLHHIKRHSQLIGSQLEWMIPADHYWGFKNHWIEANRHNGLILKDGLLFMYQLEFIVGSLVVGVAAGCYIEGVTTEMQNQFATGQYDTLGFWVCTSGTLATVVCFIFIINAYVTTLLLLPINANNAYCFLKSHGTQCTMMYGNFLICLMLNQVLVFIELLLLKMNAGEHGVSTFGIVIVFGTHFLLWGPVALLNGSAINVAINSGCYGVEPVIAPETAIALSPIELEDALTQRAFANIAQYAPATDRCHSLITPITLGKADQGENINREDFLLALLTEFFIEQPAGK